MIPLLKRFVHSLLFDPTSASRWLRGFLLWAAGMGSSVLAYPWDDVKEWTVREWGFRFLAAGVLGAAGLVKSGEKNPSPEQLAAMVDEGKVAKP